MPEIITENAFGAEIRGAVLSMGEKLESNSKLIETNSGGIAALMKALTESTQELRRVGSYLHTEPWRSKPESVNEEVLLREPDEVSIRSHRTGSTRLSDEGHSSSYAWKNAPVSAGLTGQRGAAPEAAASGDGAVQCMETPVLDEEAEFWSKDQDDYVLPPSYGPELVSHLSSAVKGYFTFPASTPKLADKHKRRMEAHKVASNCTFMSPARCNEHIFSLVPASVRTNESLNQQALDTQARALTAALKE